MHICKVDVLLCRPAKMHLELHDLTLITTYMRSYSLYSCSPSQVTRKLRTVYEIMCLACSGYAKIVLWICYYMRFVIMSAPALNYVQLQASVPSTLMHRLWNFYWLDDCTGVDLDTRFWEQQTTPLETAHLYHVHIQLIYHNPAPSPSPYKFLWATISYLLHQPPSW